MAQIQEQQPKCDPTTHHFSPKELKPTQIQKKSRKQLVREEDKDEKYWDKVRFFLNICSMLVMSTMKYVGDKFLSLLTFFRVMSPI